MVLRKAQRRYPGDVWLNFNLAACLERLARREEAIRYYMAARALRPETAHVLAHALEQKGESDQAIAIFQDLTRLRPKEGAHLTCLGDALKARGRIEEAKVVLDTAVLTSTTNIGRKPDDPIAHSNLGFALWGKGKIDQAIAEFAAAYADQNERDHQALAAAVASGRVTAEQPAAAA